MNTKTAQPEIDEDEVNDETQSGNPSEEGTGDESQVDRIAALEAKIDQLNAEAAKQRKLKQQAIKDRDKAKSAPKDDASDNYKELWEQERTARTALESKARDATINAAVTAQLAKVGVLKDATSAAAKLIDKEIIEWDVDEGVDEASVEAAIAVLKHKHGFLFEKKIASTNPKLPSDSSNTSSDKTMTRKEFDKMSGPERAARMNSGYTLTDD